MSLGPKKNYITTQKRALRRDALDAQKRKMAINNAKKCNLKINMQKKKTKIIIPRT